MNKGKILVVDDEENIRGSLQGILSDEGYEVCLAGDGEEALKMIRTENPDLVLLDIWIPGIDGIQTLQILKKMDVGAEVIMMSGHGSIETAVKATKLGAFDFIEKPFSLDSILRTVSDAMEIHMAKVSGEGREEKKELSYAHWFAGGSPKAGAVRKAMVSLAVGSGPVLIHGEPGLAQKYAARTLHDGQGAGSGKPFVEISCSTFSEESFDAAIKGALGSLNGESGLTGQTAGSIFFDGLDRLSAKLQRRLLKLLNAATAANGKDGNKAARVIASSHMWDDPAVKKPLIKGFTDYFGEERLRLVPLSERREDTPELVNLFAGELSEKYGKKIESVDSGLLETLTGSTVLEQTEELYSVIELAVIACESGILSGEHIMIAGQDGAVSGMSLKSDKEQDKPKHKHSRKKKGQAFQRTLRNSVVLCGQGLHSGINTGLILSPLPPGAGVVFWDISTGGRVSASPEFVRSTEYATTLSDGEVTIKTVEHLLSALASYQITNLLVKIGDEAPIMDGSAVEFCKIIENGGIEEQDEPLEPIVITETITVGDGNGGPGITAEPADEFSVEYYLDYPPPIGRQEHKYVYDSGEFYKETIAPARTFGFLKDMKMLEEAGLASGGRLSNVVLIDSEKVINTPLRFPNEPARHKILDLIGDLYLLGRPVKGRFIAKKSGHTENIAMAKAIHATLAR